MTLIRIFSMIALWMRRECGQDLAEYGLLVGVIAMLVVGAAGMFGTNLYTFFQQLALALPW